MEEQPRAILLRFPGTNCDRETARGLTEVGFHTSTVPITELTSPRIMAADLVVLSGGFSYGDYIMAGRLAQLEIERRVGRTLHDFKKEGGLLLGICNGFQILLHLGLLPRASLVANRSGRFICEWVGLEVESSNSIYLGSLPDRFELPIAHGEGRLVTESGRAEELLEARRVPLRYTENPNGSLAAIAALQDETGRVFGLMPHPERFLFRRHHYTQRWGERERGWGYYFFQSIHEYLCRAGAGHTDRDPGTAESTDVQTTAGEPSSK